MPAHVARSVLGSGHSRGERQKNPRLPLSGGRKAVNWQTEKWNSRHGLVPWALRLGAKIGPRGIRVFFTCP